MLFFAVKQASGHGSKERRRALAETSDPFSVQMREWQTALLHIKWKERGEGGRREGRGRRKAGRDAEREAAVRGSLCRSGSQGKDRQQQPSLSLFPIPRWERPPASVPPKRAAGGRCEACSSAGISPELKGELPTGPASTQAWPHTSVGARPSFALKQESW